MPGGLFLFFIDPVYFIVSLPLIGGIVSTAIETVMLFVWLLTNGTVERRTGLEAVLMLLMGAVYVALIFLFQWNYKVQQLAI